MNFLDQYQIDASRTFPYLGSEKLDISHMILGMVSELDELDEALRKSDIVNISEELADQHWYLANYCRLNGILYSKLNAGYEHKFTSNYNGVFIRLATSISKLSDLDKKYIAYNMPVDPSKRHELCQNIFNALRSAYVFFGITEEGSLTNNIAKLKVRFPDKFDAEKAINRDLEKERAELENILR